MKKIIIMICFIFLFSGCTIDYNITFKANNRIDEKVDFTIPNKTIEDSGYQVKESIEGALQSYKDMLAENSFTADTVYNTENTVVTLKSKDKMVSKFIKFLYFQKMFNGADIEDTKEYYSFKTNGIYNQSGLFYDTTGISDEGFADQVNINITFENKVISSNADKFDENTNTGTWILNKDTENKVIEFKLQKENGSQKEEEQEEKTNNNDKKSSFNFMYVLIGAGIFGIILVVVLLYGVTLNKKRNKL